MSEIQTYRREIDDLIILCQKGDQNAFEQLYRLYNKAMFNVCMRILNNTQEAEDVLQESFISAFKNISLFSKKSSFGSWLKRIVINKCIDALRTRNSNLIPLNEKDFKEDFQEEEDKEEYDVQIIKKAMAQLADGYRLILTLYLFEDYTHQQIAEKLGIQEGTSKSQYARAKKKLQELIQQNRNHEG